MKATLFSLTALAAGAIATPLVSNNVQARQSHSDISARAGNSLGLLNTDAAVVDAKVAREASGSSIKTVSSGPDLVAAAKATAADVKVHVDKINSIISQVKSGSLDKQTGADEVTTEFDAIKADLEHFASQLKGASHVQTRGVITGFIGEAASIIIGLFSSIVGAAEAALGAFGGSVGVGGGVAGLSGVLGEIVALLTGLVGGLLPGLISVLTAILAGLTAGIIV